MRIKKADIETALSILNRCSKHKYKIMGAYGGYQLVKECEFGGVESLTNFVPLGELYRTINAITAYARMEQ